MSADSKETKGSIYAEPIDVASVDDCSFYHTIELPDHGVIEGAWDLRAGIDKYLGKVDFKGKRVLDVGTASGFLCFHMESKGAEVVGYDLSSKQSWDVVPYANIDYDKAVENSKAGIEKLNNSFWFSHKALKSNAKVVYGSVYEIPEEIGKVDISTFGAILLHLKNPFDALANALKLTEETVIITDLPQRLFYGSSVLCRIPMYNLWPNFIQRLRRPTIKFWPESSTGIPTDTWWNLSPQAIQKFIAVLGFEDSKVTYNVQKYNGVPALIYTVVGKRTIPRS